MLAPRRVQRQRTAGWRMPEGAIYVGRPSPWGNPFPWRGDSAPWMAVAVGERADEAGRRAAAVIVFRWWIEGGDPKALPVGAPPDAGGGELEYASGRTARLVDVVSGLGLRMWLRDGLTLPPRPDLAPLRGLDLACWCELGRPCHADVLLEVANR